MEPYSLGRDEGEAVWVYDALDTIKADTAQTGGSFSLVEFQDFEGSTVPLNRSDKWDRGFYVLEGEYTFYVGDDPIPASAGAWVFVPRNTALAWRCNTIKGRVLNLTTPAGFEEFYREVGEPVPDRDNPPPKREPDVGALAATAAQHGVEILGPPPGA
jgi:quercetin dioxygenase-like cupin family protein